MEKKKATIKETEEKEKPPRKRRKTTCPLDQKLLLTARELGELTGYSVCTLNNHRNMKVGFPYVRIGGAIRYRMQDIKKYIDKLRPILAEGTEILPDEE